MKVSTSIITLLFSLFVLTSCFEYEDVQFKGMQGFNIEERTDDAITLRLDVKVDNPNKYNIKVKKTALDLYLNDKYLGKAKINKKVVLKKQKEETYPIYLKTSGKDLLKNAMTSFGSLLSGNINVGLKGDLKASVYGVGRKFPVEMKENVSLKGLF